MWAFTEGNFPVRMLKSVHQNYFEPKYDEFKPRTVWSLSNAFTSVFKEARAWNYRLRPATQTPQS